MNAYKQAMADYEKAMADYEKAKPIKPTAPKNPDADYEVVRKGYNEPDEDIEELFYDLADNTMPNIEQKLRQAG